MTIDINKAKVSGDAFCGVGGGVPYFNAAEASMKRQWNYFI